VFDGPELRHDSRVASRRHNGRLGNLQPTGIGPVEPPADKVLVIRKLFHASLISGFLIDGLPIKADDGQILGRDARLAHQRPGGFGIEHPGDIVQPTEFEDGKLVFKRREHLIGDLLRPRDRLARNEARTLQQAVFADRDINQHDVHAVERRPAVQAKRKHVSSVCLPSLSRRRES
jgi:hypothetical protein